MTNESTISDDPNTSGSDVHSSEPESNPSASDRFEKVMTVVEHLDELRTRLIRCLIYIAIGVLIGIYCGKPILRFLEAPAGNITFQALTMEEPVVVFLKVAFYGGLILASPFLLLEICRFIAPGLTRKERQILTPIVIGSPILFIFGAAFAYYFLLPAMLRFFSAFGQGISPINQRLDFYISLVSTILLYMGICFQLPIVIFALSFTNIVNSKILISVWRYAIFASAVVAAMITPDPTAISMLIVMAALCMLYFLSILLLMVFGR